MTKCSALPLLLLLFLSPELHASERDRSVSFDVGRSSSSVSRGHAEMDIYRIGLQWDFREPLWQGESASLGGYFEASLNRWESDFEDVTAAAFSPVFVLQFGDESARFRPYIEAGIGVAILSDDRAGGRRLGSSWQFEDRIGFGFASDKYDFHYRYMHYSNADIDEPNQGVDAHVIGISITY